MPATSRATVVLPVPGLPLKTRCRVIVGAEARPRARRPSTRSTAACRWISALTSARPTRPSSSANSSSTVLGFSGSGSAPARAPGSTRWPPALGPPGVSALGRSLVVSPGAPSPGRGQVDAGELALDDAELLHQRLRHLVSDRWARGQRAGVSPIWAAAAVAALPVARGLASPSAAAARAMSPRAAA